MGNFSEHIDQSISNLNFLGKVNNHINDRWDWQVTACFYTALHLINAHIVSKTNQNYLTHHLAQEAINPYNVVSVAKLDEEIYKSYIKLCQLSRRSRYLLNENFKKSASVDIQPTSLTYGVHLKKSIYHLDVIINFIATEYKVTFSKTSIKCPDLNGLKFQYFVIE